MRRTLITFGLITIGILFIISVVRQMWSTFQSGQRLTQEQNAVNKLEQSNNQLLQQLSYAQSDSYVEQQARDKLNYARPGEETVVIPQPQDSTAQDSSDPVRPASNWQRWWRLFFD